MREAPASWVQSLEARVNLQARAPLDGNRWHRPRWRRENLQEVAWKDLGLPKRLARPETRRRGRIGPINRMLLREWYLPGRRGQQ